MAGSEPPADFLFGYGSIAADAASTLVRTASPLGFVAELAGYRRRWDVAMDNSVDLPNYKHFVDEESGERPAVFVTFLNLAESHPDDAVNGVCLPIDPRTWEALGLRERNYERVEVTAAIRPEPPGRVWAYAGTLEARERFDRASADGRAVISRDYLDAVRGGFRALGEDELRQFEETTDPPGCPILALRRVDTA